MQAYRVMLFIHLSTLQMDRERGRRNEEGKNQACWSSKKILRWRKARDIIIVVEVIIIPHT